MLRRPETQDPVFSIQIVNACSASSAESWPLTQRKATKTLLNTSFRQRQFASLCRSNSDPDVIACSQGGLFVASTGDALGARLTAATLGARSFFTTCKKRRRGSSPRRSPNLKGRRFQWASFFGCHLRRDDLQI